MNHPDWTGLRIFINSEAIKKNYQILCDLYPHTRHGAVIKANGYGLGASQVAQILQEAGCNLFFVARPREALDLKTHLSNPATIYVFHGLHEEWIQTYLDNTFIPVLHRLSDVSLWIEAAKKSGKKLKASLKINTGMNRLGLDPEDLKKLNLDDLNTHLDIDYVHSHLSCGRQPDHPFNKKQLHLFEELCATYFKDKPQALSASCLLALPANFSLDLSRQGLNLYGAYAPSQLPQNPLAFALKVQTKILQIRWVKAGDIIGYNAEFKAEKPMRIATISMGYADGLPLSLNSHRFALKIGSFEAPLVGQISMDLATIDVSHIPEASLQENSWVDVFYDNVSLYKLAQAAQSSIHEILLRIGPRCERIFS